jgi:hypothetical protein
VVLVAKQIRVCVLCGVNTVAQDASRRRLRAIVLSAALAASVEIPATNKTTNSHFIFFITASSGGIPPVLAPDNRML